MSEVQSSAKPWTRVVILLVSLVTIAAISKYTTGKILPSDPKDALIFQNVLLLIVLGSALLEYKFTKPADSAINGLMGMLTMLPVYELPSRLAWWLVFLYCGVVCVVAMTCISVSSSAGVDGWRKRLSDLTYKPALVFGRARVLYSIVFLYAIFSFYGIQSERTAILVVFWGIFLALWPLRVPELLSSFSARKNTYPSIGKVVRTDAPDIIHVVIHSETKWQRDSVKVIQQGDGNQRYVVPLFSQAAEGQILGTGLCVSAVESPVANLEPGFIYEPVDPEKPIEELLGGDKDSTLVGFVDQDSLISQLRFHTWNPTACKEGMLVWSRVGAQRVFYQITEGTTQEEGIESNRHGYQIAVASQLGVLSPENGFEKFAWLPAMNTPVFSVPPGFGEDIVRTAPDDFEYGVVPDTAVSVIGKFADMMEYHTAILGVTGSGKTELTFDLLRHAVANKTKVICIDLTARYEGRLADLKPYNLSISSGLSEEVGQKLLDAETGAYGAGAEKKALKLFADQLRLDISENLAEFLRSPDDDKRVGIITLDEISNTKATVFITELYLTSLLNFARDNTGNSPRVLLVVEEAHTVMPEASTMGLGDYDSRALVAKIAQIALQGRKYHVGLLVVAQRTANVSKTVLTQCNTIVSFSCFDETSLGFFGNFFGKTYTAAIPNLRFLQAVIFGKGVKSQRPVIIQIPFDKNKADLG